MAKKKTGPALTDTIYRLKVTLRGARPPIWRRLEVPDCDLAVLHFILQAGMGWQNYHMHAFRVGARVYSGMPVSELRELGMEPASAITLGQIAAAGVKKFQYEYDFGDSWEHEVAIEKAVEREAGARYPRCVAGKRACPPEDCGGVWGYEELLEVLADPEHEEREERLEWLGGEFDPEAFDVEEVNRRLRGR